MKILITGGSGVLGSTLCKLFLHMGHKVTVIDSCRKEEAWRLFENLGLITYVWKSEHDITRTDLLTYDLVFDCAIGFADRPFGSESPQNTTLSNIIPSLTLLEKVRRLDKRPMIIYTPLRSMPFMAWEMMSLYVKIHCRYLLPYMGGQKHQLNCCFAPTSLPMTFLWL